MLKRYATFDGLRGIKMPVIYFECNFGHNIHNITHHCLLMPDEEPHDPPQM